MMPDPNDIPPELVVIYLFVVAAVITTVMICIDISEILSN